MEVILVIYCTLKTLEMEWKEKRNLGGLGSIQPQWQRLNINGVRIEGTKELDGSDAVDLRAAASVYFIEARARVQDVAVRPYNQWTENNVDTLQVPINLQLYMIDSIHYLVDFHNKMSRVLTEPGAEKFDLTNPDTVLPETMGDRSRIGMGSRTKSSHSRTRWRGRVNNGLFHHCHHAGHRHARRLRPSISFYYISH